MLEMCPAKSVKCLSTQLLLHLEHHEICHVLENSKCYLTSVFLTQLQAVAI